METQTVNGKVSSMQPIEKFFESRSIFITGATGLVGKVLLEKILRDCSNVETVYILMRAKRGKDVKLRMSEMLNKALFKKIHTKSFLKVVPVEGDIALPNLGLSAEDQQILCANVSVVIHSAATVKFNENLKTSYNLNVNGTKKVVELCRRMKQLVALVYVSTAYSNCDRSTVDEIVYSMSIQPEEINNMDEATAESREKELLGKRPNTYTYTKALAECFLESVSKDLPICIVRPSVVTASWRDPFPGWVDSFGGVTTLIAMWGTGGVRSALIAAEKHVDLIPVDMLVNLIIAASWKIGESESKSELKVYNCCTRNSNPLLWNTLKRIGNKILFDIPFDGAVFYPHLVLRSSLFTNKIGVFFFHFIPGITLDACAFVVGKKGRGLKAFEQFKQFQKLSTWVSTNEWNFSTKNMLELQSQMSETDRFKFNFEIKDLDWTNYLEDYCAGVRKYLLKQDESTIPLVRRKTRTTFLVCRSIQLALGILFVCGMLYILYLVTRMYSKPSMP